MSIPFMLKKLLVQTGVARYLPISQRLAGDGVDYLKYYSDKVLAAPLEELLDPATFPESPGPEVVNLNMAAPRFDSPVSGARVAADRNGLPPVSGLKSLKQAVAERFLKRDGRSDDEVLVTHGATGAFSAVLDAFINPGRKVVLFDPCSPLFSLGAKSRRATVRWVPTTTEDGRLRFNADLLAKTLRGATLLAIADPGNPTGGTLAAEDVEKIAWAAKRSDVLIYLDESFARYRYDGPANRLSALPDAAGRTLTAGSLTQGDGLGSVRVGWLSGPRQLVKACTLTASLNAPYVPTICQQIALRAVQADEDLFGPIQEEFRDRRRYAFDKLKAIGLNPAWPSGGFFFWVPMAAFGLDGRSFAERLLNEQKVLVGPGCAFGPSGGGFVRISFATEDGRLREGLARLATFMARIGGKPAATTRVVPEAVAVPEEAPPTFSRV